MKHISKITAIALLATLSACEGSDMPIQQADNHGYISFSAQPQKTATRANPYEAYDPTRHPATMGTFGYYDMPKRYASAANTIFNNAFVIPAAIRNISGLFVSPTARKIAAP